MLPPAGASTRKTQLIDIQESNVKGTFLTTHYFIKAFGAKGTIVNIASVGASLSVPGLSSYSAAKLAAIKFGESVNLGKPPPLFPCSQPH